MESTVPLKTRRTSIKTENVPIIKIVMPTWVTTGSESRSLHVQYQHIDDSVNRLLVAVNRGCKFVPRSTKEWVIKPSAKTLLRLRLILSEKFSAWRKNQSSPTCSLHRAIKTVANASILVTPWKPAFYCRDSSPNRVFLLIEQHVILMFQLGPMVSLY